MAQPPAVVIIARHGPRLDAADQSWHLSTPTPYDPPLTYGGWNQSRALGVRIASLLHAREQSINESINTTEVVDGVISHDFAQENGGKRKDGASPSEQSPRKRRRKHKVVLHTSPFLRCLQTSVAIAAGMAQFQPSAGSGSRPSSASRTPSSMHSASPRLRGLEGIGSPTLAPIAEPKHNLAHAIARKVLHEHKRHRKSKLRVDAFLGEWLNPQYFDHITPPPPSSMMVATAKAELIQYEPVDIFTPTISNKSSHSSLWGASNVQKPASRESTLDDFSEMSEALPSGARSPRKERASSVSSVGSNDSSSGRKSPFRPGHVLQPFVSTLPKPDTAVYVPPTPQYAVSSADHIPRGYVAHARSSCVDVDFQWDSSRAPQDWGDGGEYGEEWSAMHKRFRKGLNHLIQWYSQHGADDRAEDALGFDQAEKHAEEDEQEDLVVIMVTHGAGCNALIGALTGQPVLLDVGTASLTMAVRKDDAPSLKTDSSMSGSDPNEHELSNGHNRRSSIDIGLSSIYEMKLVSSSEHLRPGADPTRAPTSSAQASMRNGVGAAKQYQQRFSSGSHGGATSGLESGWSLGEPPRSNTSTMLGSVRRPIAASSAVPGMGPVPGGFARSHTMPAAPPLATDANGSSGSTPPFSPGLWSPVSRTPDNVQDNGSSILSSLNDSTGRVSPGQDMVLDFSNSPPDSRPTSSGGPKAQLPTTSAQDTSQPRSLATALTGGFDGPASAQPKQLAQQQASTREQRENITSMPQVADKPPNALSRGLSQKGLWGSKPGGDKVARSFGESPKRRWTVNQEDGVH